MGLINSTFSQANRSVDALPLTSKSLSPCEADLAVALFGADALNEYNGLNQLTAEMIRSFLTRYWDNQNKRGKSIHAQCEKERETLEKLWKLKKFGEHNDDARLETLIDICRTSKALTEKLRTIPIDKNLEEVEHI